MQKLYDKIKHFNLEDAIKIEETDRQFLAIKKLSTCFVDKNLFLLLVIANSLVCYQLSGKGENYWEEFSNYFCVKKINKESLISSLIQFLRKSKNNKRFLGIKEKRLKKYEEIINIFYGKGEFFYKNMKNLRDLIAEKMKQNIDSKTVVFSIKMFSYAARNCFKFEEFPKEIFIPIDTRLINLFEKYKGDYTDIKLFYLDLSEKLNISMLHLDGIIWTLYDKLMKNEKV